MNHSHDPLSQPRLEKHSLPVGTDSTDILIAGKMARHITILLCFLLAFTATFVLKARDRRNFSPAADATLSFGGSRPDDAQTNSTGLLPIIFLHGINGHASEFEDIMHLIRAKYGTQAPTMHSLGLCDGACSLRPLPAQRDELVDYLLSNAADLGIDDEEGFNFVGHSQGGLLARAVIQKLPPALRVRRYVSMASPQRGQWGECKQGRSGLGPEIEKKMARPVGWIAFYNFLAQNELSVANYWNDPRHGHLFRREASLLPQLNGYSDNSEDMADQKTNFLRVEKAVFLGSSGDDCINPPLSSIFEYVDAEGNATSLSESLEFSQDTFGLKTMHQEGRLILQNWPGNTHMSWIRVHNASTEKSLFELRVLPHLK
mmetsp:Transcript_26666/g.76948  ORF Transcript_26666/g.76948 Transcript_26666/m.76948 type:complete len:373 (-) Transcript_26666:38-1156(-)